MLEELASQPARLRTEFQRFSASDLLKHFRERDAPAFLPGFALANVPLRRNEIFFLKKLSG